MKFVITALALSMLAMSSASAQIQLRETAVETVQPKQPAQAKEQAKEPANVNPSKTPQTQTTGGDVRNPEPHIYKLGEHLSEAYGSYEIVDNWQQSKLAMPPDGHHWVRYGENYLLVTQTDGLIKRIVHAS